MEPSRPENIKRIVEHLAVDIGPRPIRRPDKLLQTRDYLTKYLESLGYNTAFQPVKYKGNVYHNVIASCCNIDPMEKDPRPILVVGAHFDTVSTTPGADDNASAVAGLLELARILVSFQPSRIRFACFCMEEPPVYRSSAMGSYRYARYLKGIGQKLIGMVCLEMIGFFSDEPNSQSYPFPLMNKMYPDKGNFIAMVGNLRSRPFTQRLKELFQRHCSLPVESLNAPSIVIGIDFSDHWSFNKMGYPATMVTDTAFYRNPNYHRPTDLPHTLDYKRAALVVDGLSGALLDLTS